MRALAAIMMLCGAGAAVADTPIELPSGLQVEALDVVKDAPGLDLAYRFRFVAPDLSMDLDYVTMEGDMAHLCRDYALPRLAGLEPRPSAIVIAIADRPLEFGEAAPEAVQFFEVYRHEGEGCVWDGF